MVDAASLRVLPAERQKLERRARLLAWGGITWHVVEFAIALGAGLAAGSIALVPFGADSLIEALAGFDVLWLFTGNRLALTGRAARPAADRRSFFILAAYVTVESLRTLIDGQHPQASWIEIALAAFTAVTMPLLATAKRRVGRKLHSSATVKEASQTQLCAYLSVALLVGLLANALAGWWLADPLGALVIAGVALSEGRSSWRGEGCCDSSSGSPYAFLRAHDRPGSVIRNRLAKCAQLVGHEHDPELRAGIFEDYRLGDSSA